MKLNSSMACAGLLAFFVAGSMPQAAASSIGIQEGKLSKAGNNAPFAAENLSSLSSPAGTIKSNGYYVTVSNAYNVDVLSGSPFINTSSKYFLMDGALGQPLLTLNYMRNGQNVPSTIFNFFWDSPLPSSSVLVFNPFSGSSTQRVFATKFAKIASPEWVSIDNLVPFTAVNIIGFVGETDKLAPGVLVPEPDSLCILGSGLLVLGCVLRARRRRDRNSRARGDLAPSISNTPRPCNNKPDSSLVD